MFLAATDLEAIASRTFVSMAIILVVARLVGKLFARLGQPAVLGEIVAGIALGPSLLGPSIVNDLFPAEIRPFMRVIAELGLVVFMFVVGLEVDISSIRRSGRTAAAISLTSIAFPFVLGAGVLGTVLYDDHKIVEGETVKHLSFALFIGVSMCGTAFAILARILAERRMFRIPLGSLLIACAAIDDVVAFSLLAVVLAVGAASGLADVPIQLGGLVLFVAFLTLIVRPLMARAFVPRYKAAGRLTPDLLAVLFVGLLASVWLTHEIRLATLIGAFLFGATLPREGTSQMFHEIVERVEGVSVTLLLPVFFVVAGLGVNIRGLDAGDIFPTFLILAIACIGKFVGAAIAAKLCGISNRQTLAVGVMMNTRGLAELVILQIGRDAGVLDEKMYTMLVIMAVVTTVMAGPVLKLVYPDRWLDRDIAEAERAALADAKDRSLVAVAEPHAARALADIAAAVTPNARGEVLISHLPRPAGGTELGAGMLADLGAIAAGMQELEVARANLARRGMGAVITSRPAAEPAQELNHQASASASRVMILDAALAPDVVDDVLAGATCDVVVVDGPPLADRHGPIVVEIDATNDGEVALEIAARLALDRQLTVEVIASAGARRSAADKALDALHQAGVRASESSADLRAVLAAGTAAAVVVPSAQRGAAGLGRSVPVLVVRGIDRDRAPLPQRLADMAPIGSSQEG